MKDNIKEMLKIYKLTLDIDDKKNLKDFVSDKNNKLKFPRPVNDPSFYSADMKDLSLFGILERYS